MNGIDSSKWALMVVCTLMFSIGCEDESIPEIPTPPLLEYSFFVAGHAYGAPGVDNIGFHPPLSAAFPYLNEKDALELGIFTGDAVIASTEENWQEFKADLEQLDATTYLAPGNHDLGNEVLYEAYIGPTEFNFRHKGDLFIVLETTTTNWNITTEKVAEIKALVDSTLGSEDKIFIFCHQLLWYEENTKYDGCRPNSLEGKEGETDFFTEFIPMLDQLEREVYIYAGDVGAFENVCALMYDELDQVTLIASGMGGGKNDNIVLTHVFETGEISFEVIALNGDDKTKLGALEDYRI